MEAKRAALADIEAKLSRPHDFIQPTTTIEDLNDHVVREVFANLDDFALFCIADVSTTFNRNARALISTRYKHKRCHISIHKDESCKLPEEPHFERLRLPAPSFLRNSGMFVNSLHIHMSRNCSHNMLELIHQYCGESLVELSLERVDLTADHIPKMRPLLSRITTLKLLECSWESEAVGVEMSSFCSQIEDLSIKNFCRTGDTDMSFFSGVAFPRLFTAEFCGLNFTTESIRNMLAANPQLKELKINYCSQVTSEDFPAIVRHVPQIEKISLLHIFPVFDLDTNTNCLKHLASLKSLQMNVHGISISPTITEMAAAHVPLEYLELSDFRSNREFFRGISEFKKLHTLKLRSGDLHFSRAMFHAIRQLTELTHLELEVTPMCENNLLEVIRCAPKLRKLRLELARDQRKVLNENEYKAIMDLLTRRGEKFHLEIEISAKRHVLDLPIELLTANEDKLTIKFTIEPLPSFERFEFELE